MTETVLALVPTYGLWLVVVSLLLSCLAVPVPSSVLVMAAGGFAAAGDLVLWQVQAAAFAGFVAGDQAAYGLARAGGVGLIARLRARPRLVPVLGKAQALLDGRGTLAVFLSRTVLSPLGPYLALLAGALQMRWRSFTGAAVVGAALWSLAYSLLGYVFASQITQVASLIGNAIGMIIAGSAAVGLGLYLRRSYRDARSDAVSVTRPQS